MNLKTVLFNLSFKDLIYCDEEEVEKILKIRNEDNVRKNMFTKKIICLEEHQQWLQNLKNKSDHKFYGIDDRDLFLSTDKPFCRYIKTYNKDDNSFTNHIEYCGINKNGEQKLYGKSFIHFESFSCQMP